MGEVNWDLIDEMLGVLSAENFQQLVGAVGSHNWWRGRSNLQEVARRAAVLHASNDIDLVSFFENFATGSVENPDQLAKDLTTFLWEVLPQLDVSAAEVIRCLKNLQQGGCLGPDLTWFDESLTAWARKSPHRPKYFMEAAIADPKVPVPGLVYMLVAGAEVESDAFLKGSTLLLTNVGTDAAQSAIVALGVMILSSTERLVAVQALTKAIPNPDQPAAAKEAAFRSLLQLAAKEEEHPSIWLGALLGDVPNYIAPIPLRSITASMFNTRPSPPSEPFLQFAFDLLGEVTASEKDTLQRIDHSLYGRIDVGDIDRCIDMVSAILIREPGITIDNFHMFVSAISEESEAFHALILRWLVTGQHELCSAVVSMLSEVDTDNFSFSASSAMRSYSGEEKMRLCRRAMGHLLHLPLASASVLVAAMDQSDEETCYRLGDLLCRPVLSNYPGTVHKYLAEKVQSLSGIPETVVRKVLAAHDKYHSSLEAVGRIRELEPSETERFIARERQVDMMAEAEARAKPSAFADLFPRVTMLYGNKSVFNVYGGPDDKPRRLITPMMTYSVSYEFPRESMLDPIGQMFQQFTFRFRDVEQ